MFAKQKKTKWKDTQAILKGRYLQDERRETWRTLLQRGREFQKAAASIQARDPMRGATEGVETQPRAMETCGTSQSVNPSYNPMATKPQFCSQGTENRCLITCSHRSVAAPFTVAQSGKRPKCPSVAERINHTWSLHTWPLKRTERGHSLRCG